MHLVFSTKGREPFLNPTLAPKIHAYLATVARNVGCACIRAGGTLDHVHLAIELSRTLSIAGAIEEFKTSSSKWAKTQASGSSLFGWQRGYGAFSVSPTEIDSLAHYIDGQIEHHRTRTFQEEFRGFLVAHGITFDERYVWD